MNPISKLARGLSSLAWQATLAVIYFTLITTFGIIVRIWTFGQPNRHIPGWKPKRPLQSVEDFARKEF